MKKILIIDDEVSYGSMLKINLEINGAYEVDAVTSAVEGYIKIVDNTYDLIILDILMPKIEGHVALVEIRKLCDTPVLIMSAYIPPQKLEAVIKAGAQGCVEKPVSMNKLEEIIQDILEKDKNNRA